MSKSISVQGNVFSINPPTDESAIKFIDDFLEELAGKMTADNQTYNLLPASARSTASDSVKVEALNIVRNSVHAALRAKGYSIKEFDKGTLGEKISKIACQPRVIELASRIMAARQALSSMSREEIENELTLEESKQS